MKYLLFLFLFFSCSYATFECEFCPSKWVSVKEDIGVQYIAEKYLVKKEGCYVEISDGRIVHRDSIICVSIDSI